jgi:hypothetical protein
MHEQKRKQQIWHTFIFIYVDVAYIHVKQDERQEYYYSKRRDLFLSSSSSYLSTFFEIKEGESSKK